MKRLYLLPAFAVAMMVSQAGAAPCTHNGANAYCEWKQKDCNAMSTEYSYIEGTCKGSVSGGTTGPVCTCDQLMANCKANGSLFTGVNDATLEANNYGTNIRCEAAGGTWTSEGKNPSAEALGCCKWSPGTQCWTIWAGTDPEDPSKTGAEKAAECKTGANSFWNGACPNEPTCPTGTPVYDGSVNDCKAWCDWGSAGGGCTAITPDPTGQYGTASSNCDQAKANCTADSPSKTVYTNSSCTGGPVPVLGVQQGTNLTVATHGYALHISSDRNASVTLYTLAGQKVLSGVVQAGSSVFSLKGQNPGVYYAVVQAGFNTQTVNVVLK